MSSNDKNCSLTCGSDVVANVLGRVGVNRSCLITLALVPFAWNGVVWVADAVESLWGLVTSAVN